MLMPASPVSSPVSTLQIVPMRRGSLGLQGTYLNANHHAVVLLPLVRYLEKKVPQLGFAVWRQGHNVHVLETKDGRRFVLRPFSQRGRGYLGINLSARVSRSEEIHLLSLQVDQEDLSFGEFTRVLQALAFPKPIHEPLDSEE